MFYQKGIDITNDKQMFNFLKNHFEYNTMNPWNGCSSIANNVKLYKLRLSGDWTTALNLLETGGYDEVNWMIQEWQREHNGFEVGFNGRSGGYLVLYEDDNCGNVLPEDFVDCEDYEEYKRYCKLYYGSVKANRDNLVFYTKLVQDFDKLCDAIREYVDYLSNLKFEVIEMKESVDKFNEEFANDLEYLGFSELVCNERGEVDLAEIAQLKCLEVAFLRIAKRPDQGYKLVYIYDDVVKLAIA